MIFFNVKRDLASPREEPRNRDGAKNTPTTGSRDGEQGKVRGREAGEYFPPQPRVGSMPTPSPLAPNTFQKTPVHEGHTINIDFQLQKNNLLL